MRRKLLSFGLAIGLLVILVAVVVAAPAGGGTIVRWEQTSPSTAELRVDGVTSALASGAISYDIYMRVPDGVSMPNVTVGSVGPAWTALNCGFAANMFPQPSSGPPPGSGDHGLLLIGSCTSGAAQGSVTGDNVLLATLNLASCPQGGFVMDLDSGDDVYGAPLSDLVDPANVAFYFTDQDMIDGPACGAPTAVELVNVQAETAPNSFQYGALLALAGFAAVLAGVGFVLRRRNAVNS